MIEMTEMIETTDKLLDQTKDREITIKEIKKIIHHSNQNLKLTENMFHTI